MNKMKFKAAIISICLFITVLPGTTEAGSRQKEAERQSIRIKAESGKKDLKKTLKFINFNGDSFSLDFVISKYEYEQINNYFKYSHEDDSAVYDKMNEMGRKQQEAELDEDINQLKKLCGKDKVHKEKNKDGSYNITYPAQCTWAVNKYFNSRKREKRIQNNQESLEEYDKQMLQNREKDLNNRGIVTRNGVRSVYLPFLANKNKNSLRQAALGLNSVFKRLGYNDRDIVGAILSLVQQGIKYKTHTKKDRKFFGIMMPAQAILDGYADCDGKSLLAATFFLHWPQIKVIGISTKNHYLLAAAIPSQGGDNIIEYKGNKYVLMETTDKWPIGEIGKKTLKQIKKNKITAIDEFF